MNKTNYSIINSLELNAAEERVKPVPGFYTIWMGSLVCWITGSFMASAIQITMYMCLITQSNHDQKPSNSNGNTLALGFPVLVFLVFSAGTSIMLSLIMCCGPCGGLVGDRRDMPSMYCGPIVDGDGPINFSEHYIGVTTGLSWFSLPIGIAFTVVILCL